MLSFPDIHGLNVLQMTSVFFEPVVERWTCNRNITGLDPSGATNVKMFIIFSVVFRQLAPVENKASKTEALDLYQRRQY